MLWYVVKRVIYAFFVLFCVVVVVFFLSTAMPGDPVDLYLEHPYTQADYDAVAHELGLDLPLHERLVWYISNLLHGDMGTSFETKRPVEDMIAERLPYTLYLAVAAMLFAIAISIPLGIVAATHRGTAWDYGTMLVSMVGVSMPGFWLGIILILLFALWIPILPASGRAYVGALWDIPHVILPAFSLGLAFAASNARLTRSSILEVLGQDYIRTARAKGCSRQKVLYKHALRNALIPVVTNMGIQFAVLLGGAVVIEIVFTYQGIGQMMYEAISWRDYYLLQGCILVLASAFVFINLAVDLLYAFLDPRIKYD